jgi:hypothetical protein
MGNMLAKFFVLQDDGWHHKRIDKETAKYQESLPAKKQKKLNEETRKRRYREWRANAFETLRRAGCNMHFNASASDLKEMLARLGLVVPEGPEGEFNPKAPLAPSPQNEAVERVAEASKALAKASVGTPNGTSESASPIPYSLNPKPSYSAYSAIAVPSGTPKGASPALRVCIELRKLGLTSAQSQDPRLQAALAEGATLADFRSAAAQALAVKASNPWAYALATVRGRIKDAQEGAKSGRRATNGEVVRGLLGEDQITQKQTFSSEGVIDVAARTVDS